MKLSIINGSPRSNSSNSKKILNWITSGLSSAEVGDMEYVSKIKKQDEIIERCKDSDSLLFCFPLYVDSMPGQQKLFFEKMEEYKDDFKGKSISFIIHSGFPEMVQSESLREYLEYFATDIMQMKLLGVVIIGGSEALQMAPDNMFSRQIKELQSVITSIEAQDTFPEDINIKINRRARLTGLQRFVYTINPFKHFYWNYRASKHEHKVNLKARPY
jgi:NAD(P)H-dependent FMN reductase